MRPRLRVGVSTNLLELPPVGGHGKMWNRVIAALRERVTIVALDQHGEPVGRRPRRRPAVVLADGHAELAATRGPLVVQVHEAGWTDPHQRDFLNQLFVEKIAPRTQRAIRAADRVITPSDAARRDIASAFEVDLDTIHAVHHGVDAIFRPAIGGGVEILRRRLTEPAPYVLYAGALHPRKNLPALAAAVARLADAGFPQLLLVAGGPAGDGSDPEQLLCTARSALGEHAGRLVHLGEPSDRELAALMGEADAFCLPSIYEGFGLTALEAMACGAPVVVSNRGALPEVVAEAGLSVEPTSYALADALRVVLSDHKLAAQLRSAAAARAREFTWERTAAGWLQALLAAVGWNYTRPR